MNKILDSITPVVRKARHVRINENRLIEFCDSFRGLENSFVAPTKAVDLSTTDKLQLDLVYNSANFCYWGDPQWTVDYQGKKIHGAYGMKAAFNRALEEGFPLLDPVYLESITEADFAHITRGTGNLHLFIERVAFLRQCGSILRSRYNGKASNVVESAKGDAIQLVDEITSNFPGYADSSIYDGDTVLFHKRAQLVTDNVHKLLRKQGNGLTRADELTALADYKVPQILRNFGILEYVSTLADRIESMTPIPANSTEEVEIRAFTLEACERMAKILRQKNPNLKVIDLDHWLYLKSKEPMQESKPYHRTLTTAY